MTLAKSGESWRVETANNAVQMYNTAGQLKKITTAAGQVTTLDYTDGLLTTVTGAFKHTLTLSYEDGKVISTEGATGSNAKDISYASSGVAVTDRQGQLTDTYQFAVSRGELNHYALKVHRLN